MMVVVESERMLELWTVHISVDQKLVGFRIGGFRFY